MVDLEKETVWAVAQWIIDDYSIDESIRNTVAERRMEWTTDIASRKATKENVKVALESMNDEFIFVIELEEAIEKVIANKCE